MREIDKLIVDAKNNPKKQEDIIISYKGYILKTASRITNRFISEEADEWSVALGAFNEAIHNYEYEKGSFFSFAELIIKRRLIDFSKSNKRFEREISVSPAVFEGDIEEEDDNIALTVKEKIIYFPDRTLHDEIEAINSIFKGYGFSFFDLAECSPKAEKTKKACAIAVAYICKNDAVMAELKASKQLPIKIVEKNTHLPRKILERHRKYIIAAVEILSGEYPCIAEYLKFIREEM